MKKNTFSALITLAIIVIISLVRWLKDSQGARIIQGCEEYIVENIQDISPIQSASGFSWTVTDMVSSGNTYEVIYEDTTTTAIIHVECSIPGVELQIDTITLIQNEGKK